MGKIPALLPFNAVLFRSFMSLPAALFDCYITCMSLLSSISCLARSEQPAASSAGGRSESVSQYLSAECPYDDAGVAWVKRVVVTVPAALPITYY